jgi:hypothetical protein
MSNVENPTPVEPEPCTVEVFDLHGHPQAPRAYAWSHDTDNPNQPKKHVTVLHVGAVMSPSMAVRAAIIQEFKGDESTAEDA